MKTSTVSDPRLRLPWFALSQSTGPERLVTPFNGKSAGLGMGPAEGVQHFYDGFGRVGCVKQEVFSTARRVKVKPEELARMLPELPPDALAKRFSLSAPKPKAPNKPGPRLQVKLAHRARKGPAKPASARKPSEARPAPVVIVRRKAP